MSRTTQLVLHGQTLNSEGRSDVEVEVEPGDLMGDEIVEGGTVKGKQKKMGRGDGEWQEGKNLLKEALPVIPLYTVSNAVRRA